MKENFKLLGISLVSIFAFIGFMFSLFIFGLMFFVEDKPYYGDDVSVLARNIYFEARNSSLEDQIAVGLTVLNRVHSNKYPNSIPEVVYQPNQYSWTSEYFQPAQNNTYEKIYALSKMIIDNYDILKRDDVCMHYTNNDNYDSNHWTKKFKKKTKIGKHWYYCEEK